MATTLFLVGAALWGALGHRAMALATLEHLTPMARAELRELLGPDSAVASASVWADAHRVTHPETAPWHFVNIPLDAAGYDRATQCREDACVVEAIHRFERRLADRALPREERIDALRFLIHFVGDLHQPLHAADHGDRGGNQLAVQFFDQRRNLHWVWDVGLLEYGEWPEDLLVAELSRRSAELGPQPGTVEAWAEEAWRIAKERAYPDAIKGSRLEDAYARPNLEVAVTQLARSALRLAALLNRALDPPATPRSSGSPR